MPRSQIQYQYFLIASRLLWNTLETHIKKRGNNAAIKVITNSNKPHVLYEILCHKTLSNSSIRFPLKNQFHILIAFMDILGYLSTELKITLIRFVVQSVLINGEIINNWSAMRDSKTNDKCFKPL